MKKLLCTVLLLLPLLGWGQLDGGIYPGNDGHLKVPSLTTAQILNIPSPVEGMQAYDNQEHCMKYYNGVKWLCLNSCTCSSTPLSTNCSNWKIGGTVNEQPLDMKTDNEGNLYLLTSENNYNLIKLYKYNHSGSVIWSKNIINSSRGKIFFDTMYNPIVASYGTGILAPSTFGGFIVTLDKHTNNVLSSKNTVYFTYNLEDYSSGEDFTIDAEGNLIILRLFSGTITVGSYTFTSQFDNLANSNVKEGLITKYSPAGNLLWAYQFDANNGKASASFGNGPSNVITDVNGDIYISGSGTSTTGFTIKNGTNTYTLPYSKRNYVIKLKKSTGEPIWLYDRDGNSEYSNTNSHFSNRPNLLATAGGIYVVGKSYQDVPNGAKQYLFIDKLKISDTKTVIYSKEYESQRLETGLAGGLFTVTDVETDNVSLYVGAYFGDCLLTPAGNLCSDGTLNSSYEDKFLLKFNMNTGDFEDDYRFGSTTGFDTGPILVGANQFGHYITTRFSGSNIPFGSTNLTSTGGLDIAVMYCED